MVASLVAPLVAASCSSSPRTEPTVLAPSLDAPAPGEFPGLHQVVTFHPGVISGGVPEGEGFATLAAMGVKTVISVDGGAPDIAAAKAAGIRYIHLPMGYDGCEESRVLELTRATRDSMERGGVYIHCHHGKHRSPAAAAAVAVSMGWMTAEQAIDRMKFSGTAANYTGLFDDVAACSVLPASAIDAVSPDFPEVCMPKGMVKGMVDIDMVFDHIKEIQKAGWKTPPAHPDLVPAAEARKRLSKTRSPRAMRQRAGSIGPRRPQRASSTSAASSRRSSRNLPATSCTPAGTPASTPVGQAMPGRPRRLNAYCQRWTCMMPSIAGTPPIDTLDHSGISESPCSPTM